VPVKQVGRESLMRASRSDAPQGVLAYAEPLHEYKLEELIDPETNPFLLAFDGVTDPHNLGAIIRTGECSGVTGVILPKHRSVHITPTVAKASAGAIEHVPMAMVGGLPSALSECKDAGVWTVGLDMDGDTDIHDLTVADQPLVLIFGAEGKGLSRLTKQRCDVLARIPQYGNVASLNVSAAGAIACFEVARKRAN
jgi:23S rRNA (guanosine2251-2'-O)-methyltransferase